MSIFYSDSQFKQLKLMHSTHMSLLVSRAGITLELIVTTECLGVTEISQAACDRGVLLHIYAEIEEVLFFAGNLWKQSRFWHWLNVLLNLTLTVLTVSQFKHLVSLVKMP